MTFHSPGRLVLSAPLRVGALSIHSFELAVGLVMLAACALSVKPERGPYRTEVGLRSAPRRGASAVGTRCRSRG